MHLHVCSLPSFWAWLLVICEVLRYYASGVSPLGSWHKTWSWQCICRPVCQSLYTYPILQDCKLETMGPIAICLRALLVKIQEDDCFKSEETASYRECIEQLATCLVHAAKGNANYTLANTQICWAPAKSVCWIWSVLCLRSLLVPITKEDVWTCSVCTCSYLFQTFFGLPTMVLNVIQHRDTDLGKLAANHFSIWPPCAVMRSACSPFSLSAVPAEIRNGWCYMWTRVVWSI